MIPPLIKQPLFAPVEPPPLTYSIAPMSHAPVAGRAIPFLSLLSAVIPKLVRLTPAPTVGEFDLGV
jgi:hypothetical protein